MYELSGSFPVNIAKVLDWTSADANTIKLPYNVDDLRFDMGYAFAETFPPYDGDETDENAVNAWCAACDAAYAACKVSAHLVLSFANEKPVAIFTAQIVKPDGEMIDCIGDAEISMEQAGEIVKTFLRNGAAGLNSKAAEDYRKDVALYELIRKCNGETVPIDEFTIPFLQRLRMGESPQQIVDDLTAA